MSLMRFSFLSIIALTLTLSGCATHFDRLEPIRNAFYAGDVTSARTQVVEVSRKHRGETDVLQLDQAMIELAAGRAAEAEKLLRAARDRFDHLEQKSLAEDAASLAADDTLRSYAAEDYEKVLIRTMLALSNLMNGGEDAAAYALQINEKQSQIAESLIDREVEERLRVEAYKQVALGPYIRAMIAEESPLTLDDAVRARVQVANFAPDFRDAKADLQRAQHETPIPPGHGVLYVFALVGRGPVKEQVNAEATQAALLVADRIISAVSPRGLPPTLAPVPIPKVITTVPVADCIQVSIDGKVVGPTATIVDVGQMALLQQEARTPEIIGRAVARRVLKKGAIYAVKEGVNAAPWSPESIALNVVGIAWEATEKADLRCWGLLPDRIQVLRITVPAGEHELRLQTADRRGAFGIPAEKTVRILDGRNTYLLGQFPDSALVGEIVTSADAR